MSRIKFFVAFALLVLVTVSTYAAFLDDINSRKSWLLSQMQPIYLDRENPKFKMYDVLGITAATGCGSAKYTEYISNVLAFDEVSADGVHSPEMFALPPLVRYLYQFGDCLNENQKIHIADLLARKMNLFDHGTLNHAVLRATSWYLLAQYFPNIIWHDIDGRIYSSKELMNILKILLQRRTNKFLQVGHYEQFSPTYAIVNFFPLLNIIDFAADQSLRNSSSDEASFEISVLYKHSFQGVILPPVTRRNFQQRNGPAPSTALDTSVSQHLLWYYFGVPNLNINDIQSRHEPVYIIMVALSNWMPVDIIYNQNQTFKTPYMLETVTPSFSYWGSDTVDEVYGRTTIGKHFAIGAGNLSLDPIGYNEDTQQFGIVLESNNISNQIECYHPYWRGNLNENAWSRDRSSPFMQTWLNFGQGVLIFHIPKKDPWMSGEINRFTKLRVDRKDSLYQFVQCRIPAGFESVEIDDKWVFIKEGKAFVALYTTFGKNEVQHNLNNDKFKKYIVFKVYQSTTSIYFSVDEQTADLSFTEFKRRTLANPPKFDYSKISTSFFDMHGNYIDVQFHLDYVLNDKRVASLPFINIHNVK